MLSKSFVLRYQFEGVLFTSQFLASDDFDLETLRMICKNLSLSSSGSKNNIIKTIERYLNEDREYRGGKTILENLIRRNKKWFTIKLGSVRKVPSLQNPVELVFSAGKPEWYGPIADPDDDTVVWYIRPYFPLHWEIDDDVSPEPQRRQMRQLCFARVGDRSVSLHWQGFYIAEEPDMSQGGIQFPYWNYIPTFFDEFEEILNIKLNVPKLHELVLHRLWDIYRNDEECLWTDLRIRAESGGVSLNARSAGSTTEIDVKGIQHLARTLSLSALRELNIPSTDTLLVKRVEEALLRTLIREFGAKSYEFSLKTNNSNILKAHIYFGVKPDFPGPDSFPHVNCYTTWCNDRVQLKFVLDHILDHDSNQFSQLSIF